MARKKKIAVETDNSNWKAPKKRKPRKSMSKEQRVACLLYTSPSPRDRG